MDKKKIKKYLKNIPFEGIINSSLNIFTITNCLCLSYLLQYQRFQHIIGDPVKKTILFLFSGILSVFSGGYVAGIFSYWSYFGFNSVVMLLNIKYLRKTKLPLSFSLGKN